MWYVYILQCCDDSYYIGITNNIEYRLQNHQSGHGSKYVAAHLPFKLIYTESYKTKSDAAKREAQLKKWTRVKKKSLVEGLLGK